MLMELEIHMELEINPVWAIFSSSQLKSSIYT